MQPFPKAQPEPFKTVRDEFPAAVRRAAFLRAGGYCEEEGCNNKLFPGKFQYDHDIPTGIGGPPTLENCKCRCDECHDRKTNGKLNPDGSRDRYDKSHDKAIIAKTRRQYNKDNGIQTRKHKASIPSRPFPKSNSSLSKGKGKSKHKWSSSPMPGSKASGWKKNMDGTVSRRSEATA